MESSKSSKPPRFPARILVVEDDRTLREGIVETLRLDGYEVFEASNGAVGLEVALRHRPHVVVFDWAMPIADGPMLVGELREVVRPMPVLVAISAAEKAKAWCRDQGIPVFLLKPFDDATLRRAVGAAVSQVMDADRPKAPSRSGTRASVRPACVVAVGSRSGDDELRETLPESMRHARIVLVASSNEAEQVLDRIVPDLLVLDDIGAHDEIRARATANAIPVLVRPPHDGADPRLVAEPPPPSSIDAASASSAAAGPRTKKS